MLSAGYKRIYLTLRNDIIEEEQHGYDLRLTNFSYSNESDNRVKNMRLLACCFAVAIIGIVLGCGGHVEGASADTFQQENALTNFIRYGKGLDKELQLARYVLTHQRILNSNNKRNSELINSLLGLPKNINNIGK